MYNMYNALTRSVASFMYKVYAWMSLGLAITAVTAYGVYSTPELFRAIVTNRFVFFGLLIAQLGIVFYISSAFQKLSYATNILLFSLYSGLLGVTLSVIFAVYQIGSIYQIFGITVAMFGFMAIYGYYTKSDLTSVGQVMFMGLIGIIIAGIVNMFLRNTMLDYVISFIGILVFTALTAYDVQRIRVLGSVLLNKGEEERKIALMCALTLYLDFINLFLHLLNFLGKKK
jgi:uncharacterized protein